MISKISLKNFKCFPNLEIGFGHLNVFAGANGAGKSTVAQALLLLFQSSYDPHTKLGTLQLNGKYIDLGTGRDVLYRRSDEDGFEIGITDSDGLHTFVAKVPSTDVNYILSASVADANEASPFHAPKTLYLSADRLGPQKVYPVNMDETYGNEIGRRGEFGPLMYNRNRTKIVTNELLLLENNKGQRFSDLQTQFTLWMGRLFPGFQVNTTSLVSLDSVMVGLSLQNESGESVYSRSTHCGFGVSVAFPIVLVGLLASPATTIIVENPEAHLHPSAQSLVGEFLARVSACGAQVFVETHSDHVLNGIRIACKNKIIEQADVRFFAFARKDEYGTHTVTNVTLSEQCEFVNQPESFFDQIDKDLGMIYGIR